MATDGILVDQGATAVVVNAQGFTSGGALLHLNSTGGFLSVLGATNTNNFPTVKDDVRNLTLKPGVVATSYDSDRTPFTQALTSLYSNSGSLYMPEFTSGFGMATNSTYLFHCTFTYFGSSSSAVLSTELTDTTTPTFVQLSATVATGSASVYSATAAGLLAQVTPPPGSSATSQAPATIDAVIASGPAPGILNIQAWPVIGTLNIQPGSSCTLTPQ